MTQATKIILYSCYKIHFAASNVNGCFTSKGTATGLTRLFTRLYVLLCRYYYKQLTKGALVAVARRLGTFTVQTVSVCLHNKNIMISQQQDGTVEPQMKICIVNVHLRHNKEQ